MAPRIVGLLAQRMVRRVCSYCRVSTQPSAEEQTAYYEYMKKEIPVLYTGKGCTLCADSGYLGRIGIFEFLFMNDKIRSKLSKGFSAAEIREEALEEGMLTMGHDGMIKAQDGVTSIMEVLRCIYSIG